MTFTHAYRKLTMVYVLIVMLISICFSVVIYQSASNELGKGLERQTGYFRRLPMSDLMTLQLREIENQRQNSLDESNIQLKLNLFYFNLLILLLSSISSYYFAKKTLSPIKEMVESQNHFTADASHELKTPLTAMRTEIEVLLRNNKITLEDAKSLLNSNLEEIAKLESLSNALLKLSKYQDQVRLDFQEFSISDIIIDAYEKVSPLAKARHISFNNSLIDTHIHGDKQSLTELFVIILDNAIKYSPTNSQIKINITKDSKWVSVSVIDHGIGIKSSDIPYIFNRFYRSDTSRNKERVDGYGLGLSIAKRIADLHNGHISVESKPGKGSEFVVKIPAL
jgi:two-component system sensor histidine kinase CiaH